MLRLNQLATRNTTDFASLASSPIGAYCGGNVASMPDWGNQTGGVATFTNSTYQTWPTHRTKRGLPRVAEYVLRLMSPLHWGRAVFIMGLALWAVFYFLLRGEFNV